MNNQNKNKTKKLYFPDYLLDETLDLIAPFDPSELENLPMEEIEEVIKPIINQNL